VGDYEKEPTERGRAIARARRRGIFQEREVEGKFQEGEAEGENSGGRREREIGEAV